MTHQIAVPAAARRVNVAVLIIVASAWAVTVVGAAVGASRGLHHHTLIEGGPPLWIAVPIFLGAWLVMVAAMMVPASLPAIQASASQRANSSRPLGAIGSFLAGYAVVWLAFGLFAFLGDVALHHFVDATPWLAARPWLVAASVFTLAGIYELLPIKRRWLEVCREPARHVMAGDPAMRVGFEHGLACLGSSGALMFVMFGAGVASLPWMILLTATMVYQAVGRRGEQAVAPIGVALLGLASLLVVNPTGLPAWLLI
jgi:predicted metal-binding membrane protein